MSEPLKVGDRVVILRVSIQENQRFVGNETVVIETGINCICSVTGCWISNGVRTLEHRGTDVMGKAWHPNNLRRIPPKSDFEKAEDWFIDDLMKTLKSRERV